MKNTTTKTREGMQRIDLFVTTRQHTLLQKSADYEGTSIVQQVRDCINERYGKGAK